MSRPDQRERIGGEMHYFAMLTTAEQTQAIKRMAATGWSEHGLAHATKLSVEMIRRVLSEQSQ